MTAKAYFLRHPGRTYFALTYLLSWTGALLFIAPRLLAGQVLSKLDGLLMFPVMIIGPCLASLVLTAKREGRDGLRKLGSGMVNVHFGRYAFMLLLPPSLVYVTLIILRNIAGPAFAPNFFPLGILFGIPAGLFEEVGWTGYALPALRARHSLFRSGLIIGILWGLWHLPVMDFLGAASPHGAYWLPFALAFIAAMTAMRLIIAWMAEQTKSLLLAQCMHIVSTGSLVVLGPPNISPAQEALWYGCYAVLLWGAVCFIFRARQNVSLSTANAHI